MEKILADLSGLWEASLEGGLKGAVRLPGSLDESGLGYPDTGENAWKAGELQQLSDAADAQKSL